MFAGFFHSNDAGTVSHGSVTDSCLWCPVSTTPNSDYYSERFTCSLISCTLNKFLSWGLKCIFFWYVIFFWVISFLYLPAFLNTARLKTEKNGPTLSLPPNCFICCQNVMTERIVQADQVILHVFFYELMSSLTFKTREYGEMKFSFH